jgi:Cof subfamily protein (haloacid dehalogenase superfamily)
VINLKYKILAVDMDGTLLNSEKQITDYNLKAIEKLKTAGIKFVICSGRVPVGLRHYMNKVSKGQPVICSNGGLVLDEDNEHVIYSKTMTYNDALSVIDFLRENGDPYYHFYHSGIMCTEKFELAAADYYKFCKNVPKEEKLEIRILPDSKVYLEQLKEQLKANPSKDIDWQLKLDFRKFVVVNNNLDALDAMQEKLKKYNNLEVTKSERNNLEIMSAGINKGLGLEILAKHYGYSLEECVAVGNDENDLSMIRAAGLGVAMKNSADKIKNSADYITEKDNNNDGIAEVIEKFFHI